MSTHAPEKTSNDNAPKEPSAAEEADDSVPAASLATRGVVGGVLMGLANLVPGISGGTMLLAAGIYPRFIKAIAEITTLKFRTPSMIVLASVALSAGLAIALLAGVVKDLVVTYRWGMYSLFIGLTLGGVPVVWKMAKPAVPSTWVGAVAGFAVMGLLAVAQTMGLGAAGGDSSSWMMLFVAGLAGASAMILPGVSGGYLLLVLGQYVVILGGIESVVHALKARDIAAAMDPALNICLPVGIGVVIGIVAVSNLLKALLAKHEKPTLGVLLGLLVGAVVGLWPFQQGVAPAIGSTFKGRVVTAEILAKLPPHKFPTEWFNPDAAQIGGAIGLIVLGFAITMGVARFGQEAK